MDAEGAQRTVLERVGLVPGLVEVALRECVLVDDDRGAALELGQVGLERSRIHRHQDVRRVARRQDVARGEVDLERGDAGERARRRTNLGREVRQRRQVVAQRRGRVSEPAPRQLHSVARIAREPNDDPLALLNRLTHVFPRLCARVTQQHDPSISTFTDSTLVADGRPAAGRGRASVGPTRPRSSSAGPRCGTRLRRSQR